MLLDNNNVPYWIHINPEWSGRMSDGYSYVVTRSPVNPFTGKHYPN